MVLSALPLLNWQESVDHTRYNGDLKLFYSLAAVLLVYTHFPTSHSCILLLYLKASEIQFNQKVKFRKYILGCADFRFHMIFEFLSSTPNGNWRLSLQAVDKSYVAWDTHWALVYDFNKEEWMPDVA